MTTFDRSNLSRRRLGHLALAGAAIAFVPRAARAGTPTPASPAAGTPVPPPLPDCTGGALALTPEQTEGPYFTPGSPERASLLEPDTTGTHLIVQGYVYSAACQPVAKAKLDFWQADADGAYDNAGFRLRGHQFTDEHGAYRLETVLPGLYPGRTRHIHVKVQAPDGPTLTTQLYIPETSENAADRFYDPKLLVELAGPPAQDGAVTAFFTFVIETTIQ